MRALAWTRRAGVWLMRGGVTFALCRVQSARLAPFGMAWFAAQLSAGRSAAAMLAGILAASEDGGIADFNLRLPIGAAIALGGMLAWDALARRGVHRTARCGAMAGLAVLLPGLIDANGAPWASAQALGAALTALAVAPFLCAAVRLKPGRRRLSADERAGVWLLAGMLAAGLGAIHPGAGAALGAMLVCALHPVGAAAGAGLGAALAMARGDARLMAALCACGLAAQLCGEARGEDDETALLRDGHARSGAEANAISPSHTPSESDAGNAAARSARRAAHPRAMSAARWTCACAGLAASLATGLFLGAAAGSVAGLALGALAGAALPERWTEALRRALCPRPESPDMAMLADQLRRDASRRVSGMSAAFGALAEYCLPSCALPDEQALMARLRAALCDGCANYRECWAGASNRGARLLCALVSGAAEWAERGADGPLYDGEVPPEILRRCRRGRLIPERLQDALEDYARARSRLLRRDAQGRLAAAQFLQARALLDGLSETLSRPARPDAARASRAGAALERAGIAVREVLALSDGEALCVRLRVGEWTDALACRAGAALTACFGRDYAADEARDDALRFVRRPRLSARLGTASRPREPDVTSGDSSLAVTLDGARLLALVSDGMGSGADAARESASAVRLMGRFMAAGASAALAVETANALLLNRGGDDMFATLDMLCADLETGEAELTKLAACPTLLARDGEVLRIEGGRLPLGILERVRPAAARLRLIPGDVLLMASDGVMDAADPDALEALLLDAGDDMDLLAADVIALAGAGVGARRDDMTAVCVRVLGQTGQKDQAGDVPAAARHVRSMAS